MFREGTKSGKVVLVSSCTFPEMDNFDLLVHMKGCCKGVAREFAGAVLRPDGDGFMSTVDMGEPVDDILEAAKEAGSQLVGDGKMSGETLATVSLN